MSALGNNTYNDNPSRVWLYIKEGKIVKKEQSGLSKFDYVTGVLTDLFVKYDGNYGPELHVTLRSDGVDYVLQMRLDSGYARSFMRIAPNFELATPMTLSPSIKYKENSYPETGLFVKQNNKALKWYYTREAPNGMPDIVPCKVRNDKGQLIDGWDNTDQLKFLVDNLMVIRDLLPPKTVIENKENIAAVNAAGPYPNQSNNADDLPF